MRDEFQWAHGGPTLTIDGCTDFLMWERERKRSRSDLAVGPKFTLHPTGSQNKPRPAFINAPRHSRHNSGLSQNKSSCAGSVRKCVCLPATARAVHQRLLTTFYPEYNAPLFLRAVGPLLAGTHRQRETERGGEKKERNIDR